MNNEPKKVRDAYTEVPVIGMHAQTLAFLTTNQLLPPIALNSNSKVYNNDNNDK